MSGGYTWTTSSPSSSPQLRPGQDERARLLGKDIFFDNDFRVAPDGDWLLVDGLDCIRQAVYNRLRTSPGEYKARPDYGVGAADFVKEQKTPARRAELETRIRTNLLQDRRIQAVETAVEDLENGLRINVAVTVRGKALRLRPFDFTDDQ